MITIQGDSIRYKFHDVTPLECGGNFGLRKRMTLTCTLSLGELGDVVYKRMTESKTAVEASELERLAAEGLVADIADGSVAITLLPVMRERMKALPTMASAETIEFVEAAEHAKEDMELAAMEAEDNRIRLSVPQ